MHTLPLSFALLTYTGYWRPINLTLIKYWAYNVYSVVMISLLYSFMFCGLVDCFMIEDLETFIEKFSLFLSVFGVSCKVLNLVLRRDEIIGLTDMLLTDICVPRDNHEMNIQRKFDYNAKCVLIMKFNFVKFEFICNIISFEIIIFYVRQRLFERMKKLKIHESNLK